MSAYAQPARLIAMKRDVRAAIRVSTNATSPTRIRSMPVRLPGLDRRPKRDGTQDPFAPMVLAFNGDDNRDAELETP